MKSRLDLPHGSRRDSRRAPSSKAALATLLAGGIAVTGSGLAVSSSQSAQAATAPVTTTVSVPAQADTYVVSSATSTNYGTRASAFATAGENRAFVKFDAASAVPAGKKIVGASLRFYVLNCDVSPAGFEVHPTTNTWTETGLTAANRPAFQSTSLAAPAAVTTEQSWLDVPLTSATSVSTTAPTAFELLHSVNNSRMQFATREAGKAPTLELTLQDVAKPQTPGVRPFDMPAAATLAASSKLVFAHYFTPFPVSLDNKAPELDYYTKNYLDPAGESGKHAAYGGLLRDRPIGRSPLTGTWTATDFETDVKQARSAGIDGFQVDILSLTSYNWDRVVALLDAAHRVDPTFKIMLMPDMTTLNTQTSDALAAGIAKLAAYPAAYRLADGRLVVSPFKSENQTAAWWGTWLNTLNTKYGVKSAFVPTLLDWKKYASSFSSISYGLSQWGLSNPGSNANNPANADQAHSMGKIWMAPTHVQDERPSGAIFDEAANTETLRLSWQGVINSSSDWVVIPTWNDYSEGSQVAPSAKHGWSYLDLMSYYLTWWKTGAAPAIVRDGLYLSHRTQPYAAKPSFAETKLMTLRTGTTAARDTVEAVVFLVDPATVTVKVGSQTYTWDAPAGMSAKTFPLAAGTVSGQVDRFGTTTTKATSPFTVTNTPVVQDLQYDAVSSLRP